MSVRYFDNVAVYNTQLRQVFPGARPIKAAVSEGSKVMEHPVETGAVISDHRIILPVEITLSVVLDASYYRDIYNALYQSFLRAEQFIVQTKTGGYRNLIISEIPHDEDPATFDTVAMNLKFREIQFVTAVLVKLPAAKVAKKNKAKSSTIDRGQQTTKTPEPAKQEKSKSLLARALG